MSNRSIPDAASKGQPASEPAPNDETAEFPFGQNTSAKVDSPPDPFDPASLRLTGDMTAALGVEGAAHRTHYEARQGMVRPRSSRPGLPDHNRRDRAERGTRNLSHRT